MNEEDKLLIFYCTKRNRLLGDIRLGKLIYELIPKYKYIYEVYRRLNIKEFQGEKALNCWIAFKLGRDSLSSTEDTKLFGMELMKEIGLVNSSDLSKQHPNRRNINEKNN